MSKSMDLRKVAQKIYFIRGEKVMLDSDLAELYQVTTKRLNEQVRRNIDRFPEDFMFQLTMEEFESLRSQFATLKRGQHRKYLPYVFTEQGIAMLSGILGSKRAVQVNIAIMRAFVKMRKILASDKALWEKIDQLEREYGKKFQQVFISLRQLFAEFDAFKRQKIVDESKKRPIGFHTDEGYINSRRRFNA